MEIIEVLGIGVGLAMDAFAVSVCKGLKMKKFSLKQAIIICLFFGGFQAVMPLIGYFVGNLFKDYITEFDHWIAFALLFYLGVKMIIEANSDKEKSDENGSDKPSTINTNAIDYKELTLMAIATSIDALAVGITFAFDLGLNIFAAVSVIGVITMLLCFAGTAIGFKFGSKYKKTAEIIGGVVLILIGIKILLEGLGVLPF